MPSLTHIVWFLIIGAMAGWLSGILTKGSGFGIIGNMLIGATGAFIGGHLLHFIGFAAGRGFIPSMLTSLVGALVLLFVIHLFRRK
jgi:uncharacterized membrane protein YeaQ/YmgE (transglycosylase-associated protein family)